MALINITIEKVIVENDTEIKKLLLEIKKIVSEDPIRQQISDKLDKAIKDIKSTV